MIQVARTQGSRLTCLVLSQHHRAGGQVPELLVQVGQDLIAVGVALGDQPWPPPAGDFTDPPVQGPQAHRGAAQPPPEPTDRPGLGLGQQPTDPLAQPRAAQAGPARAGPVGKSGGPLVVVAVDPAAHRGRVAAQQPGDLGCWPALLGQQDHDQPVADAVAARQQPKHLAGAAGRAGAVGVHTGGMHTSGGLVGSFGVWKLQRPARLLRAPPPTPAVTNKTSGHPLSLFER
jgi:hypothetical protein